MPRTELQRPGSFLQCLGCLNASGCKAKPSPVYYLSIQVKSMMDVMVTCSRLWTLPTNLAPCCWFRRWIYAAFSLVPRFRYCQKAGGFWCVNEGIRSSGEAWSAGLRAAPEAGGIGAQGLLQSLERWALYSPVLILVHTWFPLRLVVRYSSATCWYSSEVWELWKECSSSILWRLCAAPE